MTTDVFTFTALRAPDSAEETNFHARYIKDDYLTLIFDETNRCYYIKRVERKIEKKASLAAPLNEGENSAIGAIVYDQLFCNTANQGANETTVNKHILKEILKPFKLPVIGCSNADIILQDYENECFQYEADFYKLQTILSADKRYVTLLKAPRIINRFLQEATLNKYGLIQELETLLENELDGKPLVEMVFKSSATGTYANTENLYSPKYWALKYSLFELLYQWYIIRRVTPVNLENVITCLRVLHLLEWLAVDAYLENPGVIRNNPGLKIILDTIISDMQFSRFFIITAEDIRLYFEAMPVIHPLFARLAWYIKPFNEIKPIGIGDLKVVKQTLLGYVPGEISYIHNVMKGESYEKSHRRLDKTEDTFSFSSEQSTDTEKEAQTTDKFEIKREADNVIKNDLQINANASVTYTNAPVVANISGGMSYHTSSEDSQKLSSNFARDVMNKAVSKVQTKASQNRSSTKISEIEEINKHGMVNTDPAATHQSGIYRWVDKKYKSQVYNYGKRMMFEFVIPEPAAFYIQSKLKAFEMFELDVPEKPELIKKTIKIINPIKPEADLTPGDIDDPMLNILRSKYDIGEISYAGDKTENIYLKNPRATSTQSEQFNSDKNINHDQKPSTDKFICLVEYNNFKITKCVISGRVRFWDQAGEVQIPVDLNHFEVLINNKIINNNTIPNNGEIGEAVIQSVNFTKPITPPISVTDSIIILDLNFNDINWYELTFLLTIEIAGEDRSSWQTKVYNKIKSIEQAKVDKINQELEIEYNAKNTDYNNKINQLKAQTINDIIKGKSEAFNKDIILKELKKHCITVLTKEFDNVASGDIITTVDAMGNIKDPALKYQKFGKKIPAPTTGGTPATTDTPGFTEYTTTMDYPSIDIEKAKVKGRYIQFLEQAFEWQQLGYIFYPYFWAAQNKWISLMSRLDYTDKNMSDFLQAGSVRVLLAVQPSYNHAVLHFLATREPWNGGNVPVIGDRLFLPLFEEIHKQQDDLVGAKPEGDPWEFTVPTSLVYLQDSASKLPEDLIYKPKL